MFKYKVVVRERDKQGMSQSVLSEKTGLRCDVISRIENGKQMNPTLLTLEKIAHALSIKVSDLIDEKIMTQ